MSPGLAHHFTAAQAGKHGHIDLLSLSLRPEPGLPRTPPQPRCHASSLPRNPCLLSTTSQTQSLQKRRLQTHTARGQGCSLPSTRVIAANRPPVLTAAPGGAWAMPMPAASLRKSLSSSGPACRAQHPGRSRRTRRQSGREGGEVSRGDRHPPGRMPAVPPLSSAPHAAAAFLPLPQPGCQLGGRLQPSRWLCVSVCLRVWESSLPPDASASSASRRLQAQHPRQAAPSPAAAIHAGERQSPPPSD